MQIWKLVVGQKNAKNYSLQLQKSPLNSKLGGIHALTEKIKGEEIKSWRLGLSSIMRILKISEASFISEDKKMDATLSVNFLQVKSLITQFDVDKKIELIEILEKETFPIRFKNLLNKFKTNEISFEEITREVEIVREKRHNA